MSSWPLITSSRIRCYHSLHWNSAPCHHDHRSWVQGSGMLSLTPLELRSMSSWSPIRSPRIRYYITHSTGTLLHVIMITNQELKVQVSYHSFHWNSALCNHDHGSWVQGSGRFLGVIFMSSWLRIWSYRIRSVVIDSIGTTLHVIIIINQELL